MEALKAGQVTPIQFAALVLEGNDIMQPFTQFAGPIALLEHIKLLVESVYRVILEVADGFLTGQVLPVHAL